LLRKTSDRGRLLSRLESMISYRFRDRRLLAEALTHRSYAYAARRAAGMGDNQRLGFFGDAVLGLIVSRRLLELYPENDEGSLSRMRASLVDTETIARLADHIRLGGFLRLSRGEEKIGGRDKPSILAGAFEALVAAVFLDGGLTVAEDLVDRLYGPLLAGEEGGGDLRDSKTRLQEMAHSLRCAPPFYILEEVSGPDHDLHFTVTVMVGDECFARGTGKTRREAEQDAAEKGVLLLEEDAARRKNGSS